MRVLSFIALPLIIFFIMAGFHNIDLAFNVANAPECMDYNGFVTQSKDDLYINGVYLLYGAVYTAFIFFIYLLSYEDKKDGHYDHHHKKQGNVSVNPRGK